MSQFLCVIMCVTAIFEWFLGSLSRFFQDLTRYKFRSACFEIDFLMSLFCFAILRHTNESAQLYLAWKDVVFSCHLINPPHIRKDQCSLFWVTLILLIFGRSSLFSIMGPWCVMDLRDDVTRRTISQANPSFEHK